jgi:hypothetical protein
MGGVMWTGYASPEWAWMKAHLLARFVIPGLTRNPENLDFPEPRPSPG